MWNPAVIIQLITMALSAAVAAQKLFRGKGKGKEKKRAATDMVMNGLQIAQAAGAPITNTELAKSAPLVDQAVESAVSLWKAVGWPKGSAPESDG